ncbi:MAG: hypothetical protein GC161_14260 [Planctomycetaceae bacterium]|nr:hypothetical protein [Planctomycetaceae bacterium]
MGARQWIVLLVVALGLVLGAVLLRGKAPAVEGVRVGPPQQAEVAAEEVSLEAVRAREDAGERVALEGAEGSSSALPAANEPASPEVTGVRTGVWVKVVDEQRTPIEGVRVVLRAASQPRSKPESIGTSAADGRVWLTAHFVANTAERRVEPAGPGTQVDGVTFDPAQLGDEPVLLVLSAGAGLDVHVVDEGGASAEGALVRLVAPQDHDSAYGHWDAIDAALLAEGRVRGGVCSFERLPAETDLLVHVEAPVPLGVVSLRARTPGAGQRASAEARFSAEDLVLLGSFHGDRDVADWGWSLFDPAPTRGHPNRQRESLAVGEDGQFVVRLGPDVWRNLGQAVCLVLYRGWDLLEAVELPPVAGPGTLTLSPVDTAEGILCAGRAVVRGEGNFEDVNLNVAGGPGSLAPRTLFAGGWAEIDDRGNYSFGGRVPSTWRWELTTNTPGWKVSERAVFRPGDRDHEVVLERLTANRAARLVPGAALAASDGWAEHLLVQVNQTDGSQNHREFVDPDGSFNLRIPVEEIQSLTVLAKWHDRPLLEWHVVPDAPLVLDLPAQLRLVALDVRGADGKPHKAKAIAPPGDWSSWYERPPETPLVLLLDRVSHDVFVRGEGYRDHLVAGVDGPRRVDLVARGVPLLLRALDPPELGSEYRLRPILSRGPKAASNFENLAALDSSGVVAVEANGLGEFYVHLQVERVMASMRMAYLVDGDSSPRIHVREPVEGEGPAVFSLTFDWERVLKTIESAR